MRPLPPPGSPRRAPIERDAPFQQPSICLSMSPVKCAPLKFPPRGRYGESCLYPEPSFAYLSESPINKDSWQNKNIRLTYNGVRPGSPSRSFWHCCYYPSAKQPLARFLSPWLGKTKALLASVCRSNPQQGISSTPITASHVTHSTYLHVTRVTDAGLDLWEVIMSGSAICRNSKQWWDLSNVTVEFLNDISYVRLIVMCAVKRPTGEGSCFCKQLCSVCPVMRRAQSGTYVLQLWGSLFPQQPGCYRIDCSNRSCRCLCSVRTWFESQPGCPMQIPRYYLLLKMSRSLRILFKRPVFYGCYRSYIVSCTSLKLSSKFL